MKWELVAAQTGAMGEEARRTRCLDVLRAKSLGCAGGFDVWHVWRGGPSVTQCVSSTKVQRWHFGERGGRRAGLGRLHLQLTYLENLSCPGGATSVFWF